MKNKAVTIVMGLVSLAVLASCGGTNAPASTTAATSVPAATTQASEPAATDIFVDTYTDIDTLDLASGNYMVANVIYAFDKENKKISSTKYEDYDAYKNKQGTALYDGSVRFVKVTSVLLGNFNAAYFEVNGTVYLLYEKPAGSFRLSTRPRGGWSTSSAVLLGEIPTFSMGNYVSDKQSQNKVNEEGNYVYDSQGFTIREEYYFFLELTETKASVFLGDNPTTHAENPLHSVENYKIRFISGKLHIDIPHKDGDFACTLTSKSETEIKFVDAMERKGDYSCSGTFTKIA